MKTYDLKELKEFIVKQHCLPWRFLNWLNYHIHPLYMFLIYFRVNLNTKRYWEKRWAADNYEISEGRVLLYKQVAAKVPRGSLVLDVGCGDGSLMGILRTDFNIRSFGIDFSTAAIKKIKKKGLEGSTASATDIPFHDESFDAVVAVEMFEHLSLKDCGRALGEMKRVCKAGGSIIISVPTQKSLTPQNEPEHLRAYAAKDLEVVLSQFIRAVDIEESKDGLYWITCGKK